MRVVVAPDKFAGTFSAREAAQAIADGWRRRAPGDELRLVPLSDGGTGYVDVLHGALGGELLAHTVTGPLGAPVPAAILLTGGTQEDGPGPVAYLEAAQACGLHLVPPERLDARRASTVGVGELLREAIREGARTVVLGLGGTASTDGGAGLLAALGAQPAARLDRGGAALAALSELDLRPARDIVRDVHLVVATDVDNPLLGLRGASNVFGPQKGADPAAVVELDAALSRFAELAARGTADGNLANAAGAGAAGGLGFALLLLGAERRPGIAEVMRIVGLPEAIVGADLVLTGEGAFDGSSLRGKVVSGVASAAQQAAVPCVVLAGRVEVGRREMGAAGIDAAYALSEPMTLAALAERVARTWWRPK
jgi:glycerate 2-kinase